MNQSNAIPSIRAIEQVAILLSVLIVALLGLSFILSHELEQAFEKRFIFSSSVLGLSALYLRFGLQWVDSLSRALYRITVVMMIWAISFYFLPYPQWILYLLMIPGFYFLFRLEVKKKDALLEDRIAAGFLFGLGGFLFFQQQPLHAILFPEREFQWNTYLHNGPQLLLTGLGIMRLRAHVAWSGLPLLGSLMILIGLGCVLVLTYDYPFWILVALLHGMLFFTFLTPAINTSLRHFCHASEEEIAAYKNQIYYLSNTLLQLCALYAVSLIVLLEQGLIENIALAALCCTALLYQPQQKTVSIFIAELTLLFFPLCFFWLPQFQLLIKIALLLVLIAVTIGRRHAHYQRLIAPISVYFVTGLYASALLFDDFLTPLGLAFAMPILGCWIAFPERPINIPRRYHLLLWPMINGLILVCIHYGYSPRLLPLWTLISLAIPMGIFLLLSRPGVIERLIHYRALFVEDWMQQLNSTLGSLILFTTAVSVFALYYNLNWYINSWHPVLLTIATLGFSIGFGLFYTIRTGNLKTAIGTELLTWLLLALIRWKLSMAAILSLGSPWDGYLFLAIAFIVAGIREKLIQTSSVFLPYLQKSMFFYAMLGWLYLFATQFIFAHDAEQYYLEMASILMALFFYWISKTQSQANLIYTFVFVNIAILFTFYKQELVNPLFYIMPVLSSVLIMAQLFKDHLSRTQMKRIRLICSLLMLAVASFYNIIDFDESIWYPVVAAFLSTLGVIVGISLRVRIYLYLGMTFFFVNSIGVLIHVIINQPPETTKLIIGVIFLIAGIIFTGSFLWFQMKRQEYLARYNNIKTTLATWD